MLLLNTGLRQKAEAHARTARVAELSSDPAFSELFMSGMALDFSLEI